MAITRSTAAARAQRTVGTESRFMPVTLLVMSSAIVAVGLFLVYKAKTDSFERVAEQLVGGRVLNLNAATGPADIAPLLTVFSEAEERQFAAKKIYEFITGADARSNYRREIANIYDLARVRVEEKEIGPRSQLDVLKKRLADERARAEQKAAESKTEAPSNLSMPLFTRSQLNGLKPLFVVREPSGFRNLFLLYAALYFASFYLVFVIWRVRAVSGDGIILPIIHVLTGIGFMMMISLRDPLADTAIFADFTQGVVGGALIMAVAGLIDYQRSTLRRLSFIPLIAGFVLSAALVVFGKGPAGSDAKVNLLGFQPVELIKILIVLFLAGYFASHWEILRELKAKPISKSLRWVNLPRLQYMLPLVVSMAVVLGFFFLQKDLGPALILACSFLALYGVARNRFALVSITLVALVTVFYVGYRFSFPATVADRIHMWLSPWDNLVRGGDQLAHSLWALSTGAATGTGLGLGEPGYIPAGHTDLIGATVGEELGFFGLLAIFALYIILVYRSLRISLSASGDYAMFLGIGLTLIIAIEILLISGGTVGVLPLSGVVLPFLSYGKSSMLANFAIFGMLMSISARRGDEKQAGPFNRPVRRVAIALAALSVAVLAKAAYAQVVKADDVLVAGSLALQGDGSLRYQYNPRIREVAREIPRGNILDRNGIPIATSRWEDLEKNRKRYEELGINIDQACSRSDSRHYPFAKNGLGASLYHLIGDARYPINWAADNTGFFVEREYKQILQGYDDKPKIEEVKDARTGQVNRAVRYDYRELVPVLRNRYNKDNEDAKRILDRNHDVRLSIDIRLQFRVAEVLKKAIQQAKVERGSIVVLDPQTGDLLACASFPWPGDVASIYAARDEGRDDRDDDALFDRARWGLYPPG
jgi:cell division protein FtsW (lipid II flippase)